MQRDLEALEFVCKHYDACYSSDALRREKNRGRALQRRVTKLEAENALLKARISHGAKHVSSGGTAIQTLANTCEPLTPRYARSIGFERVQSRSINIAGSRNITLTYECTKLEQRTHGACRSARGKNVF